SRSVACNCPSLFRSIRDWSRRSAFGGKRKLPTVSIQSTGAETVEFTTKKLTESKTGVNCWLGSQIFHNFYLLNELVKSVASTLITFFCTVEPAISSFNFFSQPALSIGSSTVSFNNEE